MILTFATNNTHKVEEVRAILAGTGVQVRSLAEAGLDVDPPETGDTFEHNALQKASFIQEAVGGWVVADDSGIEVDALGGEPGVFSKRFAARAGRAGPEDAANNALLLERLAGSPDRRGRFRCVLALVGPGVARTVDGRCEGAIAAVPRGEGGFGYDPLFLPDEAPGRTMAELSMAEKNAISHRGRAFRRLPELVADARGPGRPPAPRAVSAGHVDLYQLTSLVGHHASGLTHAPVVLAFFSRKLPTNPESGAVVRSRLVWAGLGRCLDHLRDARFTEAQVSALCAHPTLGPALRAQPALVRALERWRFRGVVRAPREGTPLSAGPATRRDGRPLDVDGVRPAAYAPYLEIETDLLSAKLIETPLLSFINHMTMVASKAAEVVAAARELGPGRTVLEFGQRRTHPEAAADAALAAWIAGCSGSSNVEAHLRHGVPVSGTMDHFAVQAWERPGVPRHETERAFFRAFSQMFPGADYLLVDTYDTFGERTGIRNAVEATGAGPTGIRIDSSVSRETIARARSLLDALGATHTRIVVSGGLDEHAIRALGDAPVDGYGIGERIVTSPDAPVGVGAVAKLSVIAGRPTMKLSRGSGKATLPGRLQVWRTDAGDLVGLEGESHPGEPLLTTVRDLEGERDRPSYAEVRAYAREALARSRPGPVAVSDALAGLVERVVREG